MSFHLARCQSSNIFDAIAPLAGTIFDYMNICSPSTNISVLVLHGTNDNVINYVHRDDSILVVNSYRTEPM